MNDVPAATAPAARYAVGIDLGTTHTLLAFARLDAAAPVIEVLASYGMDGDDAFYAALEFWAALHGFVLLEMTGVMDDVDADAVFSDMVLRLSVGLQKR